MGGVWGWNTASSFQGTLIGGKLGGQMTVTACSVINSKDRH